MSKHRIWVLAGIAGSCLCAASTASASPLTYNFTANVFATSPAGDTTNVPDITAGISPSGTLVSGSFTYDPTDTGGSVINTLSGDEAFQPIRELHVTLPAAQVDVTSFMSVNSLVVFNDWDLGGGPHDEVQFSGITPTPAGGGLKNTIVVFLAGGSPSLWPDASAPSSISFSDFAAGTFSASVAYCNSDSDCVGQQGVSGFIQSISLAPSTDAAVPEPASLTLLGSGLVLAARKVRRRPARS